MQPDCCNHNCQQGRTCIAQPDRRRGPTWFWFLFGWILHGERRSGFDRRQRLEEMYDTGRTLYGVPIVIDETVPPGKAEFRSGRRKVETDITPTTGDEK